MSDAALDPEEMEAIQAAIRQTGPARGGRAAAEAAEAAPLALIASDRDARSARPRLLSIATPWSRHLERALRSALGGDAKVNVVDAEIVDGRSLRDELRTMWRAGVRLGDRPGTLVVAVGGPVVEVAAARRCGAASPAAAEREPSAVAIRLFDPAGKTVVGALARAFRDRDSVELTDADGATAVEALYASDVVIAVTLTLVQPCGGRIRLFALPATIATGEAPLDAHRAEASAVARALALVPVEVRAVLGTVELSLAELGQLAPGATFTLPTFVDSPVPVYLGGVLKAHARPVVSRGVIAVEIESVIADRGASR